MEQCSETSAHKIQTPKIHPKERLQHSILVDDFVRFTSTLTLILTEYGVLSTSGLACPPIHVEVCVSVWSPLAQNARTCMYHIYKVGVRRVKVMGSVVPHEEQDGRIQSCKHVVTLSHDHTFCPQASKYLTSKLVLLSFLELLPPDIKYSIPIRCMSFTHLFIP